MLFTVAPDCLAYQLQLTTWHIGYTLSSNRPPIHLLHRMKLIQCYKEEGPVSYE